MNKLPAIAIGVAAAALAGTAIAATPKTHRMDVPLPDGSVAHITYVGEVAPKVSIDPRPLAYSQPEWGMPFPSFAGFDKIFQEMNQRTEEMMRRAQQVAHQPAAAAPYIASSGNVPAGQTSTTVVSVSNDGATCTRSTEVVSQGSGKPPKVTSSVSGQGGPATAPSGPVTRT